MKVQYSLISSFCLAISAATPVIAQISTDGSTNTSLSEMDNGIQIDRGEQANGNLFHSFREFSVSTGSEVFFNNPSDVVNIFSRVTGGNISNIDGLIRANGGANLFLINPAGIIFGEGATLDIGGSFYGSTADSIVFPNEIEFAASNPVAPLLTVKAPIGLQFRDNPGTIVNQSTTGLRVKPGNNLALVGGDITLAGGKILGGEGTGKIELVSVAEQNLVKLEPEHTSFKLGYDAGINFSDISLNQGAKIITSEGDIKLRGNQISLANGSQIMSKVEGNQVGGDITLQGRELLINNQANIATITSGDKNAGNINLDITDTIKIFGTGFQDFENLFIIRLLSRENLLDVDTILESGTGILTASTGKGATGETIINSSILQLQEGGFISGIAFAQGDIGRLIISNNNFLEIRGSGIFNVLASDSMGNGNILKINTKNLTISDGGVIANVTLGKGHGGDIFVDALEQVNLVRSLPDAFVPTGIFSNSGFENGKAGNITITTQRLNLKDGGQITSASGIATREGNITQGGIGGNISITAGESIEVSGGNFDNTFLNSAIASSTFTNNNAGNLNINTEKIIVTNNGAINTASFINQDIIDNTESLKIGTNGSIDIDVGSLFLNNGFIEAVNNSSISTSIENPKSTIDLKIKDNLILENGSTISAEAGVNASGGNININSPLVIAFPGNNDILANAEKGKGGNINITAQGILGIQKRDSTLSDETNDIDASSRFGQSGRVIFNVPDTNTIQDVSELSLRVVAAETVVADACSANRETTSLVIQGKGGIPPAPNLPLNAELLFNDGQILTSNTSKLAHQELAPKIKPVETAQGDIYPARGVIKTEEGKLILTAYTTGLNRLPHNVVGCQ